MPRGVKISLNEETVNKIKELNSSGVKRYTISKNLKIPYSKVCEVLTPKNKVVITSIVLAEIEKEFDTLSCKELSRKYGRSVGEMRGIFKSLGWDIPKDWEETNPNEYKNRIIEMLDKNMSYQEIGDVLGLDRNKIYYICKKFALSKKDKIIDEPVINQTSEKAVKTYQEILRETADSIRDKLRKQFS